MCLANIEHPAHICSYVVTDAGEVCSICEEPKPVQEQRPSKKRAEKINQLDYCRRWLLGEVDKGRWSNEQIAASVADVLDYFRAADEPPASPEPLERYSVQIERSSVSAFTAVMTKDACGHWVRWRDVMLTRRASVPPAAPRVPDTFGTDPNDYAT